MRKILLERFSSDFVRALSPADRELPPADLSNRGVRPSDCYLYFLRLCFLARSAAHAEKRVAFIIGKASDKKAVTLQNPKNDATTLNSVHLAYRPTVYPNTRHKFV